MQSEHQLEQVRNKTMQRQKLLEQVKSQNIQLKDESLIEKIEKDLAEYQKQFQSLT